MRGDCRRRRGTPVAWLDHAGRPPAPCPVAAPGRSASSSRPAASSSSVLRRRRPPWPATSASSTAQIDRVDDLDLAGRAAGEPANFLLVGTDSREGIDPNDPDAGGFLGDTECNCTDTIMVLRVDPGGGTRPTSCRSRATSSSRSPAPARRSASTRAHAHGEQTLIDTIQDNFDIPIHHYVEIDFVGFEKLVDAVGGVPMWFDAPVRDRHTGLDDPRGRVPGAQRRAGPQVRALPVPPVPGRGRRVAQRRHRRPRPHHPPAGVRAPSRRQGGRARGSATPSMLNELVSAGVANVEPRRAARRRRPAQHRAGVRGVRLRRPRRVQHPDRAADDVGRRAGGAAADAQGADRAQRVPRPAARHAQPREPRRHGPQRHRRRRTGRPMPPARSAPSASTSSTSSRTRRRTSPARPCSTGRSASAAAQAAWPRTSPAAPRWSRSTTWSGPR